jgi:Na+/melibiose symporter-like transporter
MMNTVSTNALKLQRLPWAIANVTLISTFAQLTFGGPIFVLLLDQLSFSKAGVGLLLAFFPLCSLVVLGIAPQVARLGYKRTYQVFSGLSKLTLAGLLFIPWVLSGAGQSAGLIFVGVVVLLFAVLRAVADASYNPWFQDFVPDTVRGRFSMITNVAANVAGVLALVGASVIIGAISGLERFQVLLVVGLLLGVLSLICARYIPGGAGIPHAAPQSLGLVRLRDRLDVLQNRDFLLFLAGVGLITLSSAALTFLPLLLKEYVGLTEGAIVLLAAATLSAGLLSSYAWTWAAERWGSRPIMVLSVSAIAALPVAWVLVPRHHPISSGIALLVAVITGMATAGWSIGSIRVLFNRIMPRNSQADYLSVHYAWVNLVSGLGSLLTGITLDLLHATAIRTPNAVLDPFTDLFIASMGLTLLSIVCFQQIVDDKAIRTRELAGMLLRGNPIRAAGSFIRYRRARVESERVSITEHMGSSKNPLNVHELLDALSDPSFNVRHEAIVAITRMRPDERLFNALVEVLHGNEPDLGVSAAWALGRLGDKRAIEPLREALASRYALIQARSARSLATLGDYDIIPLLLERFQSEADDGMRIAYASALGALHARDAVPGLLDFLCLTRGKDLRMELALALMRVAGNAEEFVLLARATRADAGGALSQYMLMLKRLKHKPVLTEVQQNQYDECADSFTRGDLERGARRLAAIVEATPLDAAQPIHRDILRECTERLNEHGSARMEYVLLAACTLRAVL